MDKKRFRDLTIILRSTLYGEDDLIVTFLSEQHGKIAGVAKHGRKSKKRFPNCLEPGNLAILEFQQVSHRELVFLLRGELKRPYPYGLDGNALNLLHYLLGLADHCIPTAQSDAQIFSFLVKSLESFTRGRLVRAHFEARLLALCGFGINLKECLACKRTYKFQGQARFFPGRGGLLCLRCYKGEGLSIPLSSQECVLLHRWQGTDPDPDKETTTFGTLETLDQALAAHMNHFVGPIPGYLKNIRRRLA